MVHGIVSHSLWLESIAVRLVENQVNVLAIDRRGAGMNLKDRGDAPNTDTLLADLDAAMQWSSNTALTIHLCGFCWGGNYVVNYLQSTGRKFASCMFIAPSLFPSSLLQDRPFKTGPNALATEEPVMPIDQFTQGPEYETFILPDPLRLHTVSQRLNLCMQQFSTGIWMKFLRLKLPCLLILGTQDSVVDNTATQRLFDRLKIRPKQLHHLPACHGIQFDQPQSTAALIIDWIETVDSSNNNTFAEQTEREQN